MGNERLYELLEDNPEFTEKLIKIILEKEDFSISFCEQYDNVVPCIKVTADNGDHIYIYGSYTDVSPEAVRIYSSQACYDAGAYRDTDIYLIFLCDHDYFGNNEPVVWFETRDVRRGIPLNDGLNLIYFNWANSELLQELNNLKPHREEKESGKINISKILRQIVAEDTAKEVFKAMVRMEKRGRITVEEAAEECEMTVEEFLKKKEELEAEVEG